ncbi:aminodeoxychorismate lyase [Bacillus sp. REN10]|uniref:aminodeoxychorismate lyase n=1 Tax=Bacillus sp. REN10 TaxID=2782541 RepID=UPI00193B3641|nr:aminodeoxychorismate lyase [Bacillus sp. REN10]
MYIFLNGQWLPKEEAKISPFDHGFLYGLGVFETIRTYEGQPFLLEEHIARLQQGLCEMQIDCSITTEDASKIITGLCEKNNLLNSSVRLNISAGEGAMGPQIEPFSEPTVFAFQRPIFLPSEIVEKEVVLLNLRRNTPETEWRMKSHHYFNNIAAKREVGADPAKEGLFLTKEGYVAEGVVSNIFWVKAGTLFTPALETGILNGITRMFLLKRAKELKIPFVEGLYSFAELLTADEIFLTNSIQEIAPVHLLEGKAFPGKKGKLTKLLYQDYQRSI